MAKIIEIDTGMDLENVLSSRMVDEEEDFANLVVSNTLDGILAYDRRHHYTLWNPAMELLTGLPKAEVVGRAASEVFPEMYDRLKSYFDGALAGRTVTNSGDFYEVPSTNKQGYVYRCHIPLKNELGQIVGGLAVVRDVTEQMITMRELQRLNETLELRVRERTSELEGAVRSLKFLAEAGQAISSLLDRKKIVQTLGPLACGYFDGWCLIQLKDEGGANEHLVFHRDPRLARSLGELRSEADILEILSAMRSHFCAPIRGRERVWGSLSIASSTWVFHESELQVGMDLAARVGFALDNARMFEQIRKSGPGWALA